jgi:integrase/recombinase XerD
LNGDAPLPPTAARCFLEFYAATIRNKNTRTAYYRSAICFFAWCDRHHLGELADIEPAACHGIEGLQKTTAKPTVKQHLAAIHLLFDWLVTSQVVATNPANSVPGPKHVVMRQVRVLIVVVLSYKKLLARTVNVAPNNSERLKTVGNDV